jgi:hypothetical protein
MNGREMNTIFATVIPSGTPPSSRTFPTVIPNVPHRHPERHPTVIPNLIQDLALSE